MVYRLAFRQRGLKRHIQSRLGSLSSDYHLAPSRPYEHALSEHINHLLPNPSQASLRNHLARSLQMIAFLHQSDLGHLPSTPPIVYTKIANQYVEHHINAHQSEYYMCMIEDLKRCRISLDPKKNLCLKSWLIALHLVLAWRIYRQHFLNPTLLDHQFPVDLFDSIQLDTVDILVFMSWMRLENEFSCLLQLLSRDLSSLLVEQLINQVESWLQSIRNSQNHTDYVQHHSLECIMLFLKLSALPLQALNLQVWIRLIPILVNLIQHHWMSINMRERKEGDDQCDALIKPIFKHLLTSLVVLKPLLDSQSNVMIQTVKEINTIIDKAIEFMFDMVPSYLILDEPLKYQLEKIPHCSLMDRCSDKSMFGSSKIPLYSKMKDAGIDTQRNSSLELDNEVEKTSICHPISNPLSLSSVSSLSSLSLVSNPFQHPAWILDLSVPSRMLRQYQDHIIFSFPNRFECDWPFILQLECLLENPNDWQHFVHTHEEDLTHDYDYVVATKGDIQQKFVQLTLSLQEMIVSSGHNILMDPFNFCRSVLIHMLQNNVNRRSILARQLYSRPCHHLLVHIFDSSVFQLYLDRYKTQTRPNQPAYLDRQDSSNHCSTGDGHPCEDLLHHNLSRYSSHCFNDPVFEKINYELISIFNQITEDSIDLESPELDLACFLIPGRLIQMMVDNSIKNKRQAPFFAQLMCKLSDKIPHLAGKDGLLITCLNAKLRELSSWSNITRDQFIFTIFSLMDSTYLIKDPYAEKQLLSVIEVLNNMLWPLFQSIALQDGQTRVEWLSQLGSKHNVIFHILIHSVLGRWDDFQLWLSNFNVKMISNSNNIADDRQVQLTTLIYFIFHMISILDQVKKRGSYSTSTSFLNLNNLYTIIRAFNSAFSSHKLFALNGQNFEKTKFISLNQPNLHDLSVLTHQSRLLIKDIFYSHLSLLELVPPSLIILISDTNSSPTSSVMIELVETASISMEISKFLLDRIFEARQCFWKQRQAKLFKLLFLALLFVLPQIPLESCKNIVFGFLTNSLFTEEIHRFVLVTDHDEKHLNKRDPPPSSELQIVTNSLIPNEFCSYSFYGMMLFAKIIASLTEDREILNNMHGHLEMNERYAILDQATSHFCLLSQDFLSDAQNQDHACKLIAIYVLNTELVLCPTMLNASKIPEPFRSLISTPIRRMCILESDLFHQITKIIDQDQASSLTSSFQSFILSMSKKISQCIIQSRSEWKELDHLSSLLNIISNATS